MGLRLAPGIIVLSACSALLRHARAEATVRCGASMQCAMPQPAAPADCLARNGRGDGWLYEWHARTPATCPTLHPCRCFRCATVQSELPPCSPGRRGCAAATDWRKLCGSRGEAMEVDERTGGLLQPARAGACAQHFALAAQRHVREFEQRSGLTGAIQRARCKLCLTSLLGGANPWYLTGHAVFMRSLVRSDPSFDAPFVAVDGCVGATLAQGQKETLRRVYDRTFFLEPLMPTWDGNRTGGVLQLPAYVRDGRVIRMRANDMFTPPVRLSFYLRMQVLLLSSCPVVVSVDSSDMLPVAPFLPTVGKVAREHGFAAVPICSKQGRVYFNAGLFALGPQYLEPAQAARTFRELLLIAQAPPCPDRLVPTRWFGDQSVLNTIFHSFEGLLPRPFNVGKRDKRSRTKMCVNARATVIHYLGAKPWTPLDVRPRMDKRRHVLEREQLWWREYLRDKTVVVGSGPSVRAPYGVYIDMCRSVLRVNDFEMAGGNVTGTRTTHVLVHKATRGTPALERPLATLPRSHVLLAPFDEPPDVLQARMREPSGTGLELERATVLEPYYYRGLMREMRRALGVNPNGEHARPGRLRRRAKGPSVKHPLTGTIAIEWAVRNVQARPIYAIGFDMTLGSGAGGPTTGAYEHADYQRGPSGHGTRAMPTASLDVYHHVEADRAYLRKLVEDGTVALLDSLPFPLLVTPHDRLVDPGASHLLRS